VVVVFTFDEEDVSRQKLLLKRIRHRPMVEAVFMTSTVVVSLAEDASLCFFGCTSELSAWHPLDLVHGQWSELAVVNMASRAAIPRKMHGMWLGYPTVDEKAQGFALFKNRHCLEPVPEQGVQQLEALCRRIACLQGCVVVATGSFIKVMGLGLLAVKGRRRQDEVHITSAGCRAEVAEENKANQHGSEEERGEAFFGCCAAVSREEGHAAPSLLMPMQENSGSRSYQTEILFELDPSGVEQCCLTDSAMVLERNGSVEVRLWSDMTSVFAVFNAGCHLLNLEGFAAVLDYDYLIQTLDRGSEVLDFYNKHWTIHCVDTVKADRSHLGVACDGHVVFFEDSTLTHIAALTAPSDKFVHWSSSLRTRDICGQGDRMFATVSNIDPKFSNYSAQGSKISNDPIITVQVHHAGA
jgi:hypothetical protein